MPSEAEIGASGKRIKYRRLTFKEDVQGLSEEDETICTIVDPSSPCLAASPFKVLHLHQFTQPLVEMPTSSSRSRRVLMVGR